MSPIGTFLRGVPPIRQYAYKRALQNRALRTQQRWEYVQSVPTLVGNITIMWAGIERLLDELIGYYQQNFTDLSTDHPVSLSNKLEYLKRLQRDERFPLGVQEFCRETRITAKRLGKKRHDIIHGLLHRSGNLTWRTQRVVYDGPHARIEQNHYENKDLADLSKEIFSLSHDLSRKVWVLTRGDYSAYSSEDIEKALSELGMGQEVSNF